MNTREKIKQVRKQKNLSQAQIAKIIGISQAAYAKIENGDTTSITIEIGKGISKALDIPFNELFEIEFNGLIVEKVIKDMKLENERLEKEIERKQREIDNYQTLISLLKEKNMITSPRENITGDNEFIPADDEFLKKEINSMGKKDKEIILMIQNNATLREAIENGTITDQYLIRVWNENKKK